MNPTPGVEWRGERQSFLRKKFNIRQIAMRKKKYHAIPYTMYESCMNLCVLLCPAFTAIYEYKQFSECKDIDGWHAVFD